jgi:hypothetical protein
MWGKIISLACGGALLLSFQSSERQRFSGLRTVDAYEIRPGILVMPRYAADGQVCEIGLQNRLYFPEKVNVDDDLSRDEIEQAFEELVPASERGPELPGYQAHPMSEVGNAITTNTDYEHVSLEIVGKALPSKRHEVVEETVVAIIHWKNRKCQ